MTVYNISQLDGAESVTSDENDDELSVNTGSTKSNSSYWCHSNASNESEETSSTTSHEEEFQFPSSPHEEESQSRPSPREAYYPIPVIINAPPADLVLPTPPPSWYEEYTPRPLHLPSTRQTVRRDNRLLTSSSLPVFSAPNCRSIGPKMKSLIEDMRMRSIDCVLASETWE